jgi:phosphoglycerol transferase MdoB-like AlkP superfamily enzyme
MASALEIADDTARASTDNPRGSVVAESLPLRSGSRPTNVVVLVLESVGARYLGFYGAPYGATSNIDSLFGDALTFDAAYAQAPNSEPAFNTILNSQALSGSYRIANRENRTAGRVGLASLLHKTASKPPCSSEATSATPSRING